jgi:F-type H+-transporting ATPase subunit b
VEGFGINTNVLETNVINLSVVIAVLVVLGKDILSSLLDERKNKIVQSLNDVEARFQEAQEKLEAAKANLANSKQKAEEIQKQSLATAEQSRVNATKRAETEMGRLDGTKTSTLMVEKQKLVREMRTLLTTGALEKAFKKLKQERSGNVIQKKLIDTLLRDVF